VTRFADTLLAEQIELAAASQLREFVAGARALGQSLHGEELFVAGGVAACFGPGMTMNDACAVGMGTRVTSSDMQLLESFFVDRGAQPRMSACPLAHGSLLEMLTARRWIVDGYENVLIRELAGFEPGADADDIEIRQVVTDEEKADWALIAASGFSAPLAPVAEQVAIATVAASRPAARLYTAWIDGAAAGTGELSITDGLGWLSADTTLPQFQRRGVQRALQRHRLAVATAAGCELAVSEAVPGTTSQRNMERVGFRVAYTRVAVAAPEL
jgi:GNAT superfamily N-acetyltransferase